MCNAGYGGSATSGTGTCTPCSNGYYKSTLSNVACTSCGTNTITQALGISQTYCSCNVGYTGNAAAGGTCAACEGSTYKVSTGSASCTTCPSKSQTQTTGNSARSACECLPHYSGDAATGTCSICEYGYYKISSGNTACSICPSYSTTTVTIPLLLAAFDFENKFTIYFAESTWEQVSFDSVEIRTTAGDTIVNLNTNILSTFSNTNYYNMGMWTWYSGSSGGYEPHHAVAFKNEPFIDLVFTSNNNVRLHGTIRIGVGTYTTYTGFKHHFSPYYGRVLTDDRSRLSCKCNAGHTGDASTGYQCPACVNGKYKSTSGSASCTSCPTNSDTGGNTGSTSQSACVCLAGYSGNAASGSTGCTACAVGTYGAATNQNSQTCASCPTSSTTSGTGSTSQSACVCLAGYGGNAASGSSGCDQCSAGKYSEAGVGSCTDCGKGKYSLIAASSCRNCVAGKFANQVGLSECTACPVGRYKAVTGATECTACSVGKYAATTGATECTACAIGTYTNTLGSPKCLECGAGQTNSFVGSTGCFSCLAGNSSSNGICEKCTPGRYSNIDGASACTGCPLGMYIDPDTYGSTSCTKQCPSGYTTIEIGQTSCIKCEIGKTWLPSNDSNVGPSCIACPPGHFSDLLGNSGSCSKCPIGMTCDAMGLSKGIPCPIGYFTNKEGEITCSKCLANELTTAPGATSETNCTSPAFNFVIGFITLAICLGMIYPYLFLSRFERVAFFRKIRISDHLVEEVHSFFFGLYDLYYEYEAPKILKERQRIEEAQRRGKSVYEVFKICLRLFLFLTSGLLCFILGLFVTLDTHILSILFKTLIIWKCFIVNFQM
jgi:hypothetical protein